MSLREKVFKKINFLLTDAEIDEITDSKDLAIEQLLFRLKRHVENKERVITVKKENSGNKHDNLGQHGGVGQRGALGEGPGQKKLIRDLTDTVAMLEQKLAKMEEMMRVKDEKIRQLSARLGEGGK